MTITKSNNFITENQFIFIFGLYALIFISYFGGLVSTINFLITFQLSYHGTFLAKVLFFIFICLYLLKPQSGFIIYQSLLNTKILEKIFSFSKKVNSFIVNYPILTFFLVYFYIILLVLHWFFKIFAHGHSDAYLELCYYTLNLVRLFLFPLLLYSYILFFAPSGFKMVDISTLINNEENVKALKSLAKFVKTANHKAPKLTKGIALLLGVSGLTFGAGVQYGNNVRDYIINSGLDPLISPEIEYLRTKEGRSDPECIEVLSQITSTRLYMHRPSLAVTWNELKCTYNEEITMVGTWDRILKALPHLNAQAQEKAKNAQELNQSLGISNSSESPLESIGTTAGALKKFPGANTILENLWSFF